MMRGGVDAARQTRDDAEAGLAELARQRLRELRPGGGGVARTDDGDQRPGEHGAVAAHRNQRRRVVDHLQPQRVVRFAERDEMHVEGARRLQLGGGFLGRADASGPRRAAAAGKRGQSVKRGARAAEMIDQLAEGARPDILGADQAQPVDPLLVG